MIAVMVVLNGGSVGGPRGEVMGMGWVMKGGGWFGSKCGV